MSIRKLVFISALIASSSLVTAPQANAGFKIAAGINGKAKAGGPMTGAKAQDTGEGTRYGRRPKHSDKTHVRPSRKPQQ